MLRSAGIVGVVPLIARPVAKTFYTLSSCQDRDSLNLAVAQQPQLKTMQTFRSRTKGSSFAFWRHRRPSRAQNGMTHIAD